LTGAALSAAEDQDWSSAARCFAAPIGVVRQVWAEDGPDQRQIDRLASFRRAVQELEKLMAAHGAEIDESALASALDQLQRFSPDWRATIVKSVQRRDREYVTHLYSADGKFTGEGFLSLCRGSSGRPGIAWFDSWLGRTSSETEIGKDIVRQLVGPCLVPFVADRDEILSQADRLDELAISELADSGTGAVGGTYDLELDRLSEGLRSQIRFLPLLFVSDPRFLSLYVAAQTRFWRARDVIVVVIAAELHQRRRGAWPESAEVLVPEYLDSVPMDELNRPLRLHVINNRPVVYSVGYDNVNDTAAIAPEKLDAVDPRDIQYFPPVQSK